MFPFGKSLCFPAEISNLILLPLLFHSPIPSLPFAPSAYLAVKMEEQSGEGRKKSTQNFTTRNLFSVSIQIFAYICLLATLLCFSLCQIKKITHPDLFRASFTSFPYFIRYHCIISLLQYKKVRFNLDGTTSVWKGSSTGCTERLWMLNPLRFSRRVWMGPLAAWSTAWFSGQQPCLWQEIGTGWSLRSLPTQANLWWLYDLHPAISRHTHRCACCVYMYICMYIYIYTHFLMFVCIYIHTYSLKEKVVYICIQFPDASVKLAGFFTNLSLWTSLFNTISLGSQKFHLCQGHLNSSYLHTVVVHDW